MAAAPVDMAGQIRNAGIHHLGNFQFNFVRSSERMTPERKIVERLSAMDESEVSYETNSGDVLCIFCYASLDLKNPHKPDCLWVEAKELVKP